MSRTMARGDGRAVRRRPVMFPALLLGATYAVLSGGACNDAPVETESDDSTVQSTTIASAGGGGQGGQGGEPGQGGTPEACEESPCKLTSPQCGCGPGERCLLQVGSRKCLPEGESELGHLCDDDCQAAAMCTQVGGLFTPFICRAFCDVDTDCKLPGGRCVIDAPGGGGRVCSTNCDPVSNVGCLEPSMKCDVGQLTGDTSWFTFCNERGEKLQGEACVNNASCGEGHSCINVEGVGTMCLQWCLNPPNGACPANHTCNPLGSPIVVGAVQYGACVPNAF